MRNAKNLRVFNPEGANPGTLLCDQTGRADWEFVAGPDRSNQVVTLYKPDNRFITQPRRGFYVAPLAWVVGEDGDMHAAYAGDTVYSGHVGNGEVPLNLLDVDFVGARVACQATGPIAVTDTSYVSVESLRTAPPVPKRIGLEFTVAEARTLLTILGCVGGHPEQTLRGFSDGVRGKLWGAGVEPYWHDSEGNVQYLDSGHAIYFNEKSRTLVQPGEER